MAKLNVQLRNCEVDGAFRTHIEDKLGHLERFWPKVDEAWVRVTQERGRFAAEITLVSAGLITRSEERAGNLRTAFDSAVEKLEAQLKRHRKKSVARARRHDNRDEAAATVHKPTLAPAPNGAAASLNVDESELEETVVRVKRFSLKPMSPEEASLQMDLLGHNFFVFRDGKSDQVSVVYRRSSGGYGLIEPIAD